LPVWVTKRDDSLVAFEPDKISQALFAATEALGHPNAFLARELTDGVLHFLAQEAGPAIPTTAQLSELVVKVVRELGQPVLAQVFAGGAQAKVARAQAPCPEVAFKFNPADSPAAIVAKCLSAYSLHAVFSRDLAAAQRDGLLTLIGLEAPLQLAACAVGSLEAASADVAPGCSLGVALDATEALAQVVCLDSPEHALAVDLSLKTGAALGEVARAAERHTIINLGCDLPPIWARAASTGPLFADQTRSANPAEVAALADALLEQRIGTSNPGTYRIDWHLSQRDFVSAATARFEPRLLRLARLAVAKPNLTFTFDRARRPIALGEGLDRRHPAVLLAVGLHLPRLLEFPGARSQPKVFLQKLATLARLALSAGVQKRNYLRRQSKTTAGAPDLGRGFLLERARLLVVPVGLETAVRSLAGCGLEDKAGLDLARLMIERLREVLEEDGRRANLDSCIDGLTTFSADARGAFALGGAGNLPSEQAHVAGLWVAGLTAWAPSMPPRNQLRIAGNLHAAAAGGTAALFLPDDSSLQPEAVADLLHFAWRQTDVVRLRIVSSERGALAP